MRAAERGFLLLTSHLGDPDRKCLTRAQFRELARRMRNTSAEESLRELELPDLIRLGYGRDQGQKILDLLSQDFLLDHYLSKCAQAGCGVLTRISEGYPQALRSRLGTDAPGTLWYKGALSLLDRPKISLVGSRDIRPENAEFAREVGRQAAKQGFVLVSGNARGADRLAQDACLQAGGSVISVLSDRLTDHPSGKNTLLLSEEGFDREFTAPRALSRNRIIHSLPHATFVAQCAMKTGGTWDGTAQNLRHGWSRVYGFPDHSEAMELLSGMGAELIHTDRLDDLPALLEPESNLFL